MKFYVSKSNDEIHLTVIDDGVTLIDETMSAYVCLDIELSPKYEGGWYVSRDIIDEDGNYIMPYDCNGCHATGREYLDICDAGDEWVGVWRTEYEEEVF